MNLEIGLLEKLIDDNFFSELAPYLSVLSSCTVYKSSFEDFPSENGFKSN